jgi:hypothetical protein
VWLGPGQDPVAPVPLEDIKPLVLSEVLRDVDLFVGGAGVGNDPTWQDGGPGGRFREYLTSYGFGELNQGAQTRRLLLERLVPRLAIADRCPWSAASSTSRATRHTYKIVIVGTGLGEPSALQQPPTSRERRKRLALQAGAGVQASHSDCSRGGVRLLIASVMA